MWCNDVKMFKTCHIKCHLVCVYSTFVTYNFKFMWYFSLQKIALIPLQTSWIHRLCGPYPSSVMAASRLTDTHCLAWRCKSCYTLYLTLSLSASPPRGILSHCRSHPGYHGWLCWTIQGFCAPHVLSVSCIYPLSGKVISILSLKKAKPFSSSVRLSLTFCKKG